MIKVIGIPYDNNSCFLKGPALAPARNKLGFKVHTDVTMGRVNVGLLFVRRNNPNLKLL